MKLCIFLLFLSLTGKAQYTHVYRDQTYIYTLLLDSIQEEEYSVKSITIALRSNGRIIQTIHPPENDFSRHIPWDQVFIIDDYNFDGSNDIRLLQFTPANPNVPFYFWLFDKKSGLFFRNKALEVITSPEFDPKKKLISSFVMDGCCKHVEMEYRYSNGKLIRVKRE